VTDQPLEPVEPAPQEPPPPPRADEPRRLLRSRDDRVIAGVCGGLGRHLGIDPVLIRIAAVVLVFAGGAGILLYAIGWIAIPEEPEVGVSPASAETAAAPAPERASGAVVLGFVFVVLGVFFLLDELWPDFLSWEYTWPIALIAVGLAILVRGR
jgi:phage shock protein C